MLDCKVDDLLPLKNQLDALRKRTKEIDRAIKEVLDNDVDMNMMHLSTPLHASDETIKRDGVDVPPLVSDQTEAVSLISNAQGKEDERYLEAPNQLNSVAKKWHEISSKLPQPPTLSHSKRDSGISKPLSSAYDAEASLEIMLENYLNEVGWVTSAIDEQLDKIINTEENVALQIDLLRNRILRFELTLSISSFIVSCAAFVTGAFGMNLLSHLEFHPLMFWSVFSALMLGMAVAWHQLHLYGRHQRLF